MAAAHIEINKYFEGNVPKWATYLPHTKIGDDAPEFSFLPDGRQVVFGKQGEEPPRPHWRGAGAKLCSLKCDGLEFVL